MARRKSLCLNCGIEHVVKTPALIKGLIRNGLTQEEIVYIFDQRERRTEFRDRKSVHEMNSEILDAYAATGVVSPEEIATFAAILEERHPSPEDDPDSPGYVPEAFKVGLESLAIAQAQREARVRERQARFAQKYPNKQAEYQRKYRERKKKQE